jgi:hypothetical protein
MPTGGQIWTALIPSLIRGGFGVVVNTNNVEQSIARQSMQLAKTHRELARVLCRNAVTLKEERIPLPQAEEVWAASEQDVDKLSHAVRGRAPATLMPDEFVGRL